MTKAELIRKLAKNAGIPDQDAKIFFELLLKRISAEIKIGQSAFFKDFGYFHLIKGSIKKPVFSFNDNEVSEEDVDLILFSEDINLKNSDTKGLVFNVPFADDDDFHPIDAAFSLSIGKPLIPLRGVPFDDIYIPTSGYEYRRLIESKVDKLITESEIANSAEDFPTLVIDARSYNSNQVQLKWSENTDVQTTSEKSTQEQLSEQAELSDYEKQTRELKNIAWDFGEDLSQQIEVESILDIADEKINFDLNVNKTSSAVGNEVEETFTVEDSENENVKEEYFTKTDESLSEEPSKIELTEDLDADSSKKLDELLNFAEDKQEPENIDPEIVLPPETETDFNQSHIEVVDDEIIIDEIPEQTLEINENPNESEDEQFWKNTSKYFETYKPENIEAVENPEFVTPPLSESNEIPTEDLIETTDQQTTELLSENEEPAIEDNQSGTITEEISDDDTHKTEQELELESVEEQKAEYFEPAGRKNYVPFIVFPLIVIVLSLALYWYLEFFQKKEMPVKSKNISLNTADATVVKRDYEIPVSFPYPLQANETTLSENTIKPEDIKKGDVLNAGNTDPKIETTKEAKKDEKVNPPTKTTELPQTKNITLPNVKALNVGNNVFKYGDYYVVQVASFRASSISENEAGKYRNKGYNAFVEAAEIPNRGIWYRVRVGNFSTKEEAQNFINKNIRP